MKHQRKISNFNFPIVVNLGCGPKPLKGYIGFDIVDHGQEIVWDILHGIPLPDNTVKEFISYHFIEHFTFPELGIICEEMWRVGINKCRIHMHVPLRSSERAYRPAHKSFWDPLVVRGFFDGFVDEKHNRTNQFSVTSTTEKDDKMLSFVVEVNK